MEDDLMFSMEEEGGGSAKRPPVGCSAPSLRASSLSDANASSDDDDDDFLICPILDDSAKEVCDYLQGLVLTRQLSNSLPKSNFMYKVSHQTRPEVHNLTETVDTEANIEIKHWRSVQSVPDSLY